MLWPKNSRNKDYLKEISSKLLTNLFMQHMNKWKPNSRKLLIVISPLTEKLKDLLKEQEEDIFLKNWKKYFFKLIDLIWQLTEMLKIMIK